MAQPPTKSGTKRHPKPLPTTKTLVARLEIATSAWSIFSCLLQRHLAQMTCAFMAAMSFKPDLNTASL
jgi:hypothetical protein